MENYPNFKGVLLLSIGFFILFFAFNSASNIASKALRANGFENLGFHSLALLYVVFALSGFFSSSIVYKVQPKLSLIVSALAYTLWIFSLSLTTIAHKENEEMPPVLSTQAITFIILIASALNGIGSSVLWVAQGKYLSDCAQICPERKGLYTSAFWTTILASQVAANLMNSYILANFSQIVLFTMMTILSLSAQLFFMFLPELQLPACSANTNELKTFSLQYVKTTLALFKDPNIIKMYGLFTSWGISVALHEALLIPFFCDTLQNHTLQDQFRLSSLAMVIFGVGDMIGGQIAGYINDKFGGGKTVASFSIIIHIVTYGALIIFNEDHQFNYLCFVAAFLVGIQDSAVITQSNIILGFEFQTNTEPFSVALIANSLVICIVMMIESKITTLLLFRYFFITCGIISVLSQLIIVLFFNFKPVKQGKELESEMKHLIV